MNSATKPQPGAGHGNGSVATQYQPEWSASSSPVQTSSSTSGSLDSTTPACPNRKCSPSATAQRYRLRQVLESGAPGRRSGPPTHTPATALACGDAGAGPRGPGPNWAARGRLTEGRGGLPPKLHLHVECLRTAFEHEADRVAGLLRADDGAQVVERADAHSVRLQDDVAAERPRVA